MNRGWSPLARAVGEMSVKKIAALNRSFQNIRLATVNRGSSGEFGTCRIVFRNQIARSAGGVSISEIGERTARQYLVALRSEGISLVPMVIQHVANADIEFPENYLGLPRSYLLQSPRPVLVGDFF
jgi:hypothetical protein